MTEKRTIVFSDAYRQAAEYQGVSDDAVRETLSEPLADVDLLGTTKAALGRNHAEPSEYLLVVWGESASEQNVLLVHRLRGDFVAAAETLDPLLLLQELAHEIGLKLQVGRQRSRFIFAERVLVHAPHGNIVEIINPEDRSFRMSWHMTLREATQDYAVVEIALAFATDRDRHLEWLTGDHIDDRDRYDTCFISYGEPDVDLAMQIRNDLDRYGVDCWLYALDNTLGQRSWSEISGEVRRRDRIIVICSAAGLSRDGVLKELEIAIDEDPDKIIAVSRDDDWKADDFSVRRGDSDLKPHLLERNYADMSKARNVGGQTRRLLERLKRPEP